MNCSDLLFDSANFDSFIGGSFKVEDRPDWILPKTISLNMKPLSEARNGAKSFFTKDNALNWSDIYALRPKSKDSFNHQDELEWIIRWYFGNRNEVRELFCQNLGYQLMNGENKRILNTVLENREFIFTNGGYENPKNYFNIGIYYAEKQAHRGLKKIIDGLSQCEAFIVNGDETFIDRNGDRVKMTNANCEEAIKKAVDNWIDRTKKEGSLDKYARFVILADAMATRSLTVPEITYVFITGNSIGVNPFEQKSKRPSSLGKMKEKDTVVYDCSLSIVDYSFNGAKQVENFARKHNKSIREVLREQSERNDKEHDENHIFCPYYLADFFAARGECVSPWSEQSYLEYEEHMSNSRASAELLNVAINSAGFNDLDVSEKQLKNNEDSPKENQRPGTDVVQDVKQNGKREKKTGNGSSEEEIKRIALMRSLINEFINCEYQIYAYPVDGENDECPFEDRDKVYRERWIDSRWHVYMGNDKKTKKKMGKEEKKNRQKFAEIWDWFVDVFRKNSQFNLRLKKLAAKRRLREVTREQEMFDFI